MADTRLILHVKGTESDTAVIPREDVRTGVWEGKFTESQLIWRPTENTWKPVRELPELIPPVEKLILHVKGTDAETRQLPRPAVRAGISKGEITHSQLIWRPDEHAWKPVRELPDLLPSQKLAPAPVRVDAPQTRVEEIIPEAPNGPVERAVAASDAIPRVKVAAVPTPVAVPTPRVAVAVAREEETVARVSAPQPRIATPVPRVAVAVPVAGTQPEETAVPVARAVPTIATPTPRPRVAVDASQPAEAAPIPVMKPRVAVAAATSSSLPLHAAAGAPPKIRIVPTAVPNPVIPVSLAGGPVTPEPAHEPGVEPVAMAVEPLTDPVSETPVPVIAQPVTPPSALVPRVVPVPRPAVASVAPEPEAAAAVPRPVAVPKAVAVPKVVAVNPVVPIKSAGEPITPVSEPAADATVAPPPVAPAPKAAFKVAVAAPAAVANAAPAPKATSHKVRSHEGFSLYKWVCIGLGGVVLLLVTGNYLFVTRPLSYGMSTSQFSNVSVFGHLAAFVQPDVVVIHIRPSESITDDNFTKFLVALARSTPANPISNVSFARVALTPGWSADYSFSGYSWKQLADMGSESESTRKEFILDQLATGGGEPLLSSSAVERKRQDDRREKVWDAFVHSFTATQ